ncbi:YopX family protein [Bacillus thuringiensis]|nr:YopX family protein [Bacillus thuringiensis]
MREIKFRAWDGMSWVYSECISKDGINWWILNNDDDNWLTCLDPQQYTGLKDKNGKEIYEGDVLDLSLGDDSVLRCEVIYEAPSFCRKWYNANTIRLRQREIEPMAWNTHIVYEVIGNIYENPELLER